VGVELVTGIDPVEPMFRAVAGEPILEELLAIDWSDPKNLDGDAFRC
jgi:hypothetical protein